MQTTNDRELPNTTTSLYKWGWVLLLLAIVEIALLYGPERLSPLETDWLRQEGRDRLINLLGWEFFRYAHWSWPLTHIDVVLPPFGSNVINFDAIPLVAICFKTISSLLPEQFQYFGLWQLLSFWLMGMFTIKILKEYKIQNSYALYAAIFLMLSRPLIERSMHITLTAQWIILAAFLVVTKNVMKSWRYQWEAPLLSSTLVFTALGIHPYLWMMSLITILLASISIKNDFVRQLLFSFSLIVASIAGFVFWGYSSMEQMGDVGFNVFHADVLSFFCPSNNDSFLITCTTKLTSYEGACYWGVGGSILVLALLFSLFKGNAETDTRKKLLHYSLIAIVFYLFSLGSVVEWNGTKLFSIPWYALIEPIPSIFRAPGRFIWPAYYFLITTAIITLYKRFTPRTASITIMVAIFAQGIELGYALDGQRIMKGEKHPALFADHTQKIPTITKIEELGIATQKLLTINANALSGIQIYTSESITKKIFPLLAEIAYNKKIPIGFSEFPLILARPPFKTLEQVQFLQNDFINNGKDTAISGIGTLWILPPGTQHSALQCVKEDLIDASVCFQLRLIDTH
jgi:hypothetical protein